MNMNAFAKVPTEVHKVVAHKVVNLMFFVCKRIAQKQKGGDETGSSPPFTIPIWLIRNL